MRKYVKAFQVEVIFSAEAKAHATLKRKYSVDEF